jgi:hypothetical protein
MRAILLSALPHAVSVEAVQEATRRAQHHLTETFGLDATLDVDPAALRETMEEAEAGQSLVSELLLNHEVDLAYVLIPAPSDARMDALLTALTQFVRAHRVCYRDGQPFDIQPVRVS